MIFSFLKNRKDESNMKKISMIHNLEIYLYKQILIINK